MQLTSANCATLDHMASRYVGTGEAADAVGVSRNTLERWAREGKVTPASRTAGKHYRWDLDDLQRQLREINKPQER
jgi:excisionase family DNA binding protein